MSHALNASSSALHGSSEPGQPPVVLITGALAGIGRATAVEFAQLGHRVVVSGRRPEVGAALVEELRALGGEAEFVEADVRNEDDVRRLVDRSIERFGRLDIAINNAGTEGTPGPFVDQTLQTYESVFDTNVRGTLLSMKYELLVMQRQKSGSIVNISSTMGERGAANMAMYVGSKHAVEGFTKSAAIEAAAHGVRVNAVAPGPTDTAMLDRLNLPGGKAAFYATVPLRRGGRPEEIAQAIVFVASEGASFITGQIVRVNGGRTAS